MFRLSAIICFLVCFLAPGFLAPGFFVMLSVADMSGRAYAQQAKNAQQAKSKPSKPKTRRSEVLGKAAFQRIEEAQKRLAEEQYDAALEILRGVQTGQGYKPYEKAVALQTMGFVYAGLGDYPKTIKTFEAAIATGHLPVRVVNDLTYNLAQLNLAEGRHIKALALLARWFNTVEGEPAADAYALKAQIHLIMNDLPAAEKAIRMALSKAETPKRNWIRILLSVLLQQERFAAARPVLEDAVQRWPGQKVFWQQLAAVYYEVDEEKLAFVAQQAMHIQAMLQSSKELSHMAQLYLYHNVPIKAATVLQTGIDDGSIEKSEQNYEILAQAYMRAREWKKAVVPLTRVAEKSKKGKFYQQLGQSYVQDENWTKAEVALQNALAKGGLEDPADSWFLLGITRTRLEKWDQAIDAFRKAGDDDRLAKDAFRWIRSIERQLAATSKS